MTWRDPPHSHVPPRAAAMARGVNMRDAGEWAAGISETVAKLRAEGVLTSAEVAAAMNTRRTLTRRGRAWCAQSVYLCARRARLNSGAARRESDDVIADLKAQWRAGMEAHVVEARRSGARRVEDIATLLNARGVQTFKGR